MLKRKFSVNFRKASDLAGFIDLRIILFNTYSHSTVKNPVSFNVKDLILTVILKKMTLFCQLGFKTVMSI